MEKRWYVVHTYSGYENKVKANLEKRVESMGMEDKIFRVLVPMEEELVNKDGKKKTVMRKVYPGYVLVEMVQTDESWYVVRNTPGVTGFVGSTGSGSKPTALLPEEVEQILKTMGMEEPRMTVEFELKESVRIKVGPFANFVGTVEEIVTEKQKLKVHVNMFGRETPLELDYHQVEKI
ncbi:transcription termination/antitermination protein NusG [Paenibacillus sp. ACRRX]|uniref:transcription termination/antitermination protein NusG n=1 Tax=Paenibacillus TaxID=44249 RepID=UPI0004148B8C|nr:MULTISPECIES: transcription termination/antitermination protein NusG [Paenibacillus]MCG7410650.1 transcription termination/antitermination protein NusG [Paenibacillus sp. ACRRX]MDK8184155.1 transcription termination/antitermination protein NusG [Paenibacillus sp. UMB4589-SE434]